MIRRLVTRGLLPALFLACAPAFAQEATPRIIGGQDATGDWPWAARILIDDPIGGLCSGSLLSPRWVVTAAHCFYDGDGADAPQAPPSTRVLVEIGSQPEGSNPSYLADSFHVHPGYSNALLVNDIALIKLPAGAATQAPAVLPSLITDDAMNALLALGAAGRDEAVTAIGWGATQPDGSDPAQRLQEAALDYVPFSTCDSAWGGQLDGNVMVCAAELNPGSGPDQDTCFGDSGGPLFLTGDPDPFILGITSFGESRCTSPRPTVYSRVLGLIDFVENESAAQTPVLVDMALDTGGSDRLYGAPGATLNYTTTLGNDSLNNGATTVRLFGDSDSADVDVAVNGNSCALGACYSQASAAAGASTALAVTVDQLVASEGQALVTLEVTQDQDDYRPKTSRAETTVIFSNRPDLAVEGELLSITHNANGSGEARVRVTARNLSTLNAASAVYVETALPAGTRIAGASDGVVCDPDCGLGTLAAEQSLSFTLSLSSDSPRDGQAVLSIVEDPNGDFPADNNEDRVALRYPGQVTPSYFGDSGGGGALGALLALIGLAGLRWRH